MPSYLDEIRERQALEAAKKTSPVPIVIAAIAAFAIGGLGAFGWINFPKLSQSANAIASGNFSAITARTDQKPAAVSIATSGARLGQAENANILLSCVPRHKLGLNSGFGQKIESKDIYRILQAVSQVTQVAALAGAPQGVASGTVFASLWADVADCAMSQNGWTLCDPDNRALAVEAVTTLVRQVNSAAAAPKQPSEYDRVVAKLQGKGRTSPEYELSAARSTRDRVLDNLRTRVQEGRIIAGDFGYFPPAEVTRVLNETKATRNACAEKS